MIYIYMVIRDIEQQHIISKHSYENLWLLQCSIYIYIYIFPFKSNSSLIYYLLLKRPILNIWDVYTNTYLGEKVVNLYGADELLVVYHN